MVLFGAAIASMTALLIAFVAYPWQKRRDRGVQIHAERRQAFSAFFAAMDNLSASIIFDDDLVAHRKAILDGRKALNELMLSGDDEAVKACLIAVNAIMDWRSKKNSGVEANRSDEFAACTFARKAREQALTAARVSLFGPTSQEIQILLSAAYSGELKGKL